jgi:hypothetical protein
MLHSTNDLWEVTYKYSHLLKTHYPDLDQPIFALMLLNVPHLGHSLFRLNPTGPTHASWQRMRADSNITQSMRFKSYDCYNTIVMNIISSIPYIYGQIIQRSLTYSGYKVLMYMIDRCYQEKDIRC